MLIRKISGKQAAVACYKNGKYMLKLTIISSVVAQGKE